MTASRPPRAAAPARQRAGRWWFAVVATGVGAGGVGIGITLLLHLVQHVAFGYTEDSFLSGVQRASQGRRVLVLAIGGLFAGVGWWALRRSARVVTVNEAISTDETPLSVKTTTIDALLQVIVVGLGASLGREGAPRQISGALGAWLARRCRLDAEQRRIVIAAGAGAGLAAVYNVPLGGCLFAAEVLLGSASLRVLLPAAIASIIATAVSWLVLPDQPTYRLEQLHLTWSVLVFSLLIGPVAGLLGHGFDRLASWARTSPPSSWRILPATMLVFTALGVAACAYPQLLGNGKGPTELALTGSIGLGTAAVLMLLKPLATVACLRSGAAGGLLTPALATGALLGVTAGLVWQQLWPGSQLGAFALIAAGATLAVTQRAPLCAIALTLELTHASIAIVLPLTLAVALALATDRHLPGRWTTPSTEGRSAPHDRERPARQPVVRFGSVPRPRRDSERMATPTTMTTPDRALTDRLDPLRKGHTNDR